MSETANMSLKPYEKLAVTLNKIPNSFTIIEDGTDLRSLQCIFTPEEAELVSQMNLMGETIEELSAHWITQKTISRQVDPSDLL